MPVVYQVSVYEGRPEDEEGWVPIRWHYGEAGRDPLAAAERVAEEMGFAGEKLRGLPSPSKERGWLFAQPDFGLIYEVKSLSRRTSEKGFMPPREREELSSEYSPMHPRGFLLG